MSFTAKSVIIDIADGWGDPSFVGIRAIDFWNAGTKISMTPAIFSYYQSSSVDSTTIAEYAFDTSISKTGTVIDRSWLSNSPPTNQRIIIVFDTATSFDGIRINNYHHEGGDTNRGARNVVITISDDIISNTTYNASITSSTIVFNGSFDEHIVSDVEDEQILTLIGGDPAFIGDGGAVVGGLAAIYATASFIGVGGAVVGGLAAISMRSVWTYFGVGGSVVGGAAEIVETYNNPSATGEFTAKSVMLDIADNWGDSTYLGLRAVEFWNNGSKIDVSATDFTAYSTSELTSSYPPDSVFDTSLSKVGSMIDTCWVTGSANLTNQRLICVFSLEVTFDEIRIVNFHNSGSQTSRGAQNVAITVSDDSITDTTYGAVISNSTKVFDSVFDEHVASDIEDAQILNLIVSDPALIGSGGAVAGGVAGLYVTQYVTFTATGGAVVGGTAPKSDTQRASFVSVGGAVAGGFAGLYVTQRAAFVGGGGAIAGGTAIYEPYYPFNGGIDQSVAEIYGLARTDPIGYGHFTVPEVTVQGVAENIALCWGDTNQPPAKVSAHIGSSGTILQSASSIAGVMTTVILSNGDITQPNIEIDGVLDIWNRISGAIKTRAPKISSTISSDDYVYGSIEAPAMQVDGAMYIWAVGNGDIEAPTSHIVGKVAVPEESTIIRYHRGCPVT